MIAVAKRLSEIAVICEAGWKLAKDKEHLAKLPHRLKVHGLLVHGRRPRLTKGYRNRIRAFSHLMDAGKISPEDIERCKGHLSYAASIERIQSE